jgi:hypothetical protein
MDVVRVTQAADESLRQGGARVPVDDGKLAALAAGNGDVRAGEVQG